MRSASMPPVAPPGTDPMLRVTDLAIGYAGPNGGLTRVVDEVSFRLDSDETLGIVGESGSGKSTLARALLGYRRGGSAFAGGSIEFDGVDLAAADKATLGRMRGIEVAMVPQNPLSSLTYHMRVGAQIEEVLCTRAGFDRARARLRSVELLAEMGLPDPARIADRYPHQLSGGQRQRVVIAAALSCQPRLLVLDEPTTALDKSTEAQVLDLILRLQRQRKGALILVTHDLNVVAQVCARVLVMKDGRIVEQGPVSEVFVRPRTSYSRILLGSALRLDGPDPAQVHATRPLLEAKAIDYAYSGARWRWLGRKSAPKVLDGVSFSLGKGEALGVIGESGSGKTTLGLIVAGMMGPSAGQLTFDGNRLAGRADQRTADLRRRIQVVFQDPLSSLNPRRRVGATIMQPMRRFFGLDRREAYRRAAALLDRLGMDAGYLDRFPRQLSGGQQQRIAIARAFAAEPDLLICDEITSALDATVQGQVLESLLSMRAASNVSMIFISHDLAVIRKVAARVIVLHQGRMVDSGTTSEVFRNPEDPYTAGLLAAATRASRLEELTVPAPSAQARAESTQAAAAITEQ